VKVFEGVGVIGDTLTESGKLDESSLFHRKYPPYLFELIRKHLSKVRDPANSLMAVRDREGEAVDIEKKRLSNLYRKVAALAVYLNSLPDATTSMGKPGEREKQKGLESVSSQPDPDHRDQDDQGGIRFAGHGPR
jgi:hypothetical protein